MGALVAPILAGLAITAGPALTGARVTWAARTFAVYSSDPLQRVWRAPKVRIPLYQRLGSIVGSGERVAFIRTVEAQQECPAGDICPYRRTVIRRDVWSGPPRGPFKRLNSGVALDVDVDGGRVLYSEGRRLVLGGTLALSNDLEFPDVALAGHYAAWTELRRGHDFMYTPRALVVYDLRAHSVAFRLDAAPFVDIDLAPDGTVAFGQDPTPVGGPNGGVGWASLARPSPHFLPGDAVPFRVRIGAGRIAAFARGELFVRALDGRIVARRQAAYGDFDFDGHRLAYLRSLKVIEVDRLR